MKKQIKSPQGKNKNITTLDEILDDKYGKSGNPKRDQWEQWMGVLMTVLSSWTKIKVAFNYKRN